jgi:hypothetical protein
MQLIHFNPPEALAPYIAFYGSIAVEENFHEPYCSPPLGLCGFYFNLEGENNASLNGELFLAQLPVFEIAPAVAHALDFIHTHKGNVSIKDIEAACYITPRSLERHFKMYIGLRESTVTEVVALLR